jgi:hypothetical protein
VFDDHPRLRQVSFADHRKRIFILKELFPLHRTALGCRSRLRQHLSGDERELAFGQIAPRHVARENERLWVLAVIFLMGVALRGNPSRTLSTKVGAYFLTVRACDKRASENGRSLLDKDLFPFIAPLSFAGIGVGNKIACAIAFCPGVMLRRSLRSRTKALAGLGALDRLFADLGGRRLAGQQIKNLARQSVPA